MFATMEDWVATVLACSRSASFQRITHKINNAHQTFLRLIYWQFPLRWIFWKSVVVFEVILLRAVVLWAMLRVFNRTSDWTAAQAQGTTTYGDLMRFSLRGYSALASYLARRQRSHELTRLTTSVVESIVMSISEARRLSKISTEIPALPRILIHHLMMSILGSSTIVRDPDFGKHEALARYYDKLVNDQGLHFEGVASDLNFLVLQIHSEVETLHKAATTGFLQAKSIEKELGTLSQLEAEAEGKAQVELDRIQLELADAQKPCTSGKLWCFLTSKWTISHNRHHSTDVLKLKHPETWLHVSISASTSLGNAERLLDTWRQGLEPTLAMLQQLNATNIWHNASLPSAADVGYEYRWRRLKVEVEQLQPLIVSLGETNKQLKNSAWKEYWRLRSKQCEKRQVQGAGYALAMIDCLVEDPAMGRGSANDALLTVQRG